jgi:hypothetical protein
MPAPETKVEAPVPGAVPAVQLPPAPPAPIVTDTDPPGVTT